jgi:hypothetical protein
MAQDDPRPKPNPKPAPVAPAQRQAPARSGVVIFCDLACTFTVDGQSKHKLAAGGAAPFTLGLGQHFLSADTLDIKDHYEHEFTLESTEQTLIQVQLEPVHKKRLQEEEEKKKAERVKAAEQRRTEAAQGRRDHPTWTDLSTGLMWTREDTRANVYYFASDEKDLTWDQAVLYCKTLNLLGHSDWRLPTFDELESICFPLGRVSPIRDKIIAVDSLWSATPRNTSTEAVGYMVYSALIYVRKTSIAKCTHFLPSVCVPLINLRSIATYSI